jgi:hypothetical protein
MTMTRKYHSTVQNLSKTNADQNEKTSVVYTGFALLQWIETVDRWKGYLHRLNSVAENSPKPDALEKFFPKRTTEAYE